jgi:sulfur relay protein TusC/DsrF
MVESICVMVRKAPYGTEDAFAGLKLALATTANGMDTSVIFAEDGVFCAMKDQNPEQLAMPSIMDVIDDLLSLDVRLFCVKGDLTARHIDREELIEDIHFIDGNDLSRMTMECDAQATF